MRRSFGASRDIRPDQDSSLSRGSQFPQKHSKVKNGSGMVMRYVEPEPTIGASASMSNNHVALRGVLPWSSIRLTVFSPSEKSWAMTAMVMSRPTCGLT